MNSYGQQARAHWVEWLPDRYATIKNPDEFFTMLGTEIEAEINSRYQARLLTMPTTLSDTAAEGWANMARLMVTDEVMAETAYLEPEPNLDDEDLPADPMGALSIITEVTMQGYAESEEEALAEMDRDWRERQASRN